MVIINKFFYTTNNLLFHIVEILEKYLKKSVERYDVLKIS